MSEVINELVDTTRLALDAAVHRPGSREQAANAVAAVLDVLTEHFEGLDESDCHPADTLRRLASEAREAP
jgi:hypothetical protein